LLAPLLRPANGIRLVDIPWFPEIYLPPRRDPLLDDVEVATGSSPKKWSIAIIVGLVHFHPGILQHQTNTGGASIQASCHNRIRTITGLQIGIDGRMGQEDGDNGVIAILTSYVKGRNAIPHFFLPVDIEIGDLPENPPNLLHLAVPRGEVKTRGMHWKGIKKGKVLCLRERGRGAHREIFSGKEGEDLWRMNEI